MRGVKLAVRIGWLCLAANSLAILVFGVVVAVWPPDEGAALYRADGLASAGLGLFGLLIVLVPYRRIERWAWYALWFHPLFWTLHLVGNLPPGDDHIHQVVGRAPAAAPGVLPCRSIGC